MKNETLLEIKNDIGNILKGAGVGPTQIDKLNKKLDELAKKKEDKKQIENFKKLAEVITNTIAERLENIEIKPVMNPPQVIVKGTDSKMIKALAKELGNVLKNIPQPDIIVKPPNVEVKGKEIKIPKIFQVLGIKGMVGFLKSLIGFWKGIDYKNPLPVVLTYKDKGYKASDGDGKGGKLDAIIGGPSRVYFRNKDNNTADLIESATSLTIYNVILVAANTEYSQVLPDRTRKFKIYAMAGNKIRPHRDVLKYKLGESASGNDWSGVDYIPIPAMGYDQQDGLKLTGKTLYFQSPTASGIVIIEAWT